MASPPPPSPATLAEARDELLGDVIALARHGYALHGYEPAADLDHLTAALERLERLVDPDADLEADPEPDPELETLRSIAKAARATVDAVRDSGLERDHFTGRLEHLYTALEALNVELEAAGQ